MGMHAQKRCNKGGSGKKQKEKENTGRDPRRLAALQRHRSVGGDRKKKKATRRRNEKEEGKPRRSWEKSGTIGKAELVAVLLLFTP